MTQSVFSAFVLATTRIFCCVVGWGVVAVVDVAVVDVAFADASASELG